ncbi:MAG: hypothetical protein WC627_05205 [Legionella sp.]|jgi:hypothetical protein
MHELEDTTMINPEARAKAQVAYLQAISEAAQKKYEADKAFLPLDPQERVLIEVELSQQQRKDFEESLGHPIQTKTTVSWDVQGAADAYHESLKEHLTKDQDAIIEAYKLLPKGRIISLQQETYFHAHLIGRMVDAAYKKSGKNELNWEANCQKGLDNALLKLNEKVTKLHAKALAKAYSSATPFFGSLNEEKFKAALNKELDAARKKLLPEIAKTVRKELLRATGKSLDKDIVKYLSKQLAEETTATTNDIVHIDKGTGLISFIGSSEHTAHDQQLGGKNQADRMIYSHYVNQKGTVSALSERQHVRVPSLAIKKLHKITEKLLDKNDKSKIITDNIAEKIAALDPKNKLTDIEITQIGNEFQQMTTLMQDITQKLVTNKSSDAEQTENPRRAATIKLRTEENLNKDLIRQQAFDQLAVSDAEDKIRYLQEKYTLGGNQRQVNDKNPPNAFVYNLYTTLNKNNPTGLIDEGNNKQTQSAVFILRGAHQYNRNNPGKSLCLVQNMSVNGWGHELSLNDSNPEVVNEAALMTQMATLHTIYDMLNFNNQSVVRKLFNEYEGFLTSQNSSFYSYQCNNEPNQFIDRMKLIRKGIDADIHFVNTSVLTDVTEHRKAFIDNSKRALAVLFKNEADSHHKNGFTYQALSVFVEKASIGGCKSANERTQAINGRVAILDFVSLSKATRDVFLSRNIFLKQAEKLKQLSDALESAMEKGNCKDITTNLDKLYESLNLEGYQALVSFVDQGGHAKLGTKSWIHNTNSVETVKMNVKNASSWQAHKGLADYVLKEFCGVEKYNKKIEYGIMGFGSATAAGISVAIVVAIAIGVAFPPLGLAIANVAILVAVAAVSIAAVSYGVKLRKERPAAVEARFQAIKNEELQELKEINTKDQAIDLEHSYGRIGQVLGGGSKVADPGLNQEKVPEVNEDNKKKVSEVNEDNKEKVPEVNVAASEGTSLTGGSSM